MIEQTLIQEVTKQVSDEITKRASNMEHDTSSSLSAFESVNSSEVDAIKEVAEEDIVTEHFDVTSPESAFEKKSVVDGKELEQVNSNSDINEAYMPEKTNPDVVPRTEEYLPNGEYNGINREEYTYEKLCRRPIISEIMDIPNPETGETMLKDNKLREWAKKLNEVSSKGELVIKETNGQPDLSKFQLGPRVELPTVGEYSSMPEIASLLEKGASKSELKDGIRKINYDILREKVGELCGQTKEWAAKNIGSQLDCAPHEDINGTIYMVPNWAHKWFPHGGYASKVAEQLYNK